MDLSKAEWASHLGRWRRSGESATQYCAEHGLKLGSLRYWSGRIRRDSGDALNAVFETPATGAVLSPAPTVSPPARFAKVHRRELGGAKSTPKPAPLRLFVGEVQVEVPAEFDASTLRRVLEVLGSTGGGR